MKTYAIELTINEYRNQRLKLPLMDLLEAEATLKKLQTLSNFLSCSPRAELRVINTEQNRH